MAYHTTEHRPKTNTGDGIILRQHKKTGQTTKQAEMHEKTKTNKQHNQFYPRTVNMTKIKFNHEEMSLHNKGLQYSIEKPLEKYWTDLIMETKNKP